MSSVHTAVSTIPSLTPAAAALPGRTSGVNQRGASQPLHAANLVQFAHGVEAADPCDALLDPSNVEDERIWVHQRPSAAGGGRSGVDIVAGSGCFPHDAFLDDLDGQRQPACAAGESPRPRPDVVACVRARHDATQGRSATAAKPLHNWETEEFAKCRRMLESERITGRVEALLQWTLDLEMHAHLEVSARSGCFVEHPTLGVDESARPSCHAGESATEHRELAACIQAQFPAVDRDRQEVLLGGVPSLSSLWILAE